MNRQTGLRALALCAPLLALGYGSVVAQPAAQAPTSQSSDTVQTPSGPVEGPLDLNTALQRFPLTESAKPAKQLVAGWTVPKKLVVIVDRPERTAWLQSAMPAGVTVVGVPNDAEGQKQLSDADAFILANGTCGVEHGEGSTDQYKNDPKLKWIHSASGGTDQCMVVSDLKSGKILLTNSQKVKSDGLSENAFGFIFALSRNMENAWANVQAGAFGAVRPTRPAKSLAGATLLVVGLGGAGTEIARIAHELGMSVIATRATSHEGPAFVDYVGLSTELPDMIGKADVVVIAAPLTPDTRNLFNAAMFAKMKKNAMLVDFTRAEIINPDDLAAALKSGQLGSAGLDWASDFPLPPDSPLWKAPNLIMTGSRAQPRGIGGPGGAGAAAPAPAAAAAGGAPRRPAPTPAMQRDDELRWVLVRENMRRYATGDKMFSVFDPKRGY